MQRELQPAEISDLLNRHFDLQQQVSRHRSIVASGSWDQIRMNESVFAGLPIPTKGRLVRDDKYGNVVVFPDAGGNLHYSADVPSENLGDITKPPFHSPTGNTLEQLLTDVQKGVERVFGSIVAAAVIVAVAYIALKS